MQTSPTIGKLAEALALAQGAMKGAVKDAANPFFKSKYADLASCWDACRGPLAAHGLSVIQGVSAEGAKITVTTLLAHSSGEWVQDAITLEAKDDSPQSIGSAATYGRRYGLSAAVGIAPEDDDGNASQPEQPRPKPAPTPAKPAAKGPTPNPRAVAIHKRCADRHHMTADTFKAWATTTCAWQTYKESSAWTAEDMDAMTRALDTMENRDVA